MVISRSSLSDSESEFVFRSRPSLLEFLPSWLELEGRFLWAAPGLVWLIIILLLDLSPDTLSLLRYSEDNSGDLNILDWINQLFLRILFNFVPQIVTCTYSIAHKDNTIYHLYNVIFHTRHWEIFVKTHVILCGSALLMILAGWEEESCSSTKWLGTSIKAAMWLLTLLSCKYIWVIFSSFWCIIFYINTRVLQFP